MYVEFGRNWFAALAMGVDLLSGDLAVGTAVVTAHAQLPALG
jgi:hypothetical protein